MIIVFILLFPLISGVLNDHQTTPKSDDTLMKILVNKCCGENEIFHESACVKDASRDVTGEKNKFLWLKLNILWKKEYKNNLYF